MAVKKIRRAPGIAKTYLIVRFTVLIYPRAVRGVSEWRSQL